MSSGSIIWAAERPWWPHWPQWPHWPHWPQWPQWPLLSLWPQKIQKLLGIHTMRDFLTSTTFSTSLASIASTASVASMRPKVFSLKKLVENNSFLMPHRGLDWKISFGKWCGWNNGRKIIFCIPLDFLDIKDSWKNTKGQWRSWRPNQRPEVE